MSKLTTDRVTRLLTELLQVPGNDVCADCKSPNPRWTSHNLGIFICVSCASIHRKLGTHISKVKSINLDQWTRDQVESIRVMGNRNSNAIFNPKNVEAPVNLHDSERDSELEKFIRNKYQFRKFMNVRDGSDYQSSSRGSTSQDSERINAGRARAKELLNPPVRSSSAAQPSTSQPRAASPILTTKSPAPATSTSPVPPTPSPSLPAPASQRLQPSPQPPLQILNPSPQPPLQILAPSAAMTMAHLQTGMMPMATGMPMYQSNMYTGSVNPSLQMSQQVSLPGSNPVWQDMAALQTGPHLPSFQQQPLTAVQYGQMMPTQTFATPSMQMQTMPTMQTMQMQMQMQPMATGWMNPNPMIASPTPVNPMAGPVTTSYQLTPSPQLPMGGMSPLQAQYTQTQPSFGMQQQSYQQPQPIYVSNGVAVQPQMGPGQNMMWTQGGYATQGQWQG